MQSPRAHSHRAMGPTLTVVLWSLAAVSAGAAELSVRAWIEPESPCVGEPAYLVIQADLSEHSGLMAVAPVRLKLPSVPDVGLSPESHVLSQTIRTVLSGASSTLRLEQRVLLHCAHPGRFDIPPIEATAEVGQRALIGSTEPFSVVVQAPVSSGLPTLEAPSQWVTGNSGSWIRWALGLVLLILVAVGLLLMLYARHALALASTAGVEEPSQPLQDPVAQHLESVLQTGDPERILEACLSHLRAILGGAARAMTRTEIEQLATPHLSPAGAASLGRVLDAAEEVLFAGAVPEPSALQAAVFDTILVARELRTRPLLLTGERSAGP